MSKNINKLLTLLTNSNLNNSNRRKRRKKKNRYTVVPQTSRRPQRIGIGSTVSRVTREITVTMNSVTSFQLMNYVHESYEFSRQAEDFNFYRLRCINVIQHPINVNDVAGKVWVYMDWLNETDVHESTMGTWDNAKMFSYNTVRPITYTFLPPNARLRYAKNEDELFNSDLPINYTEWIPAREMVAQVVPGWLKFMNVGSKDISVTVDVVLEFKGAKGYDPGVTKASKYLHIEPLKELTSEDKLNEKKEMNKEEIKEEEKEEERKDKRIKKKEKLKEKKERLKEYESKVQELSD